MKVYSIQEKAFIEAEHFGSSEFRPQDGRTAQCYYIDSNNMIHSNSFNYSLLYTSPVTVDEFNKIIKKSNDYHRITIY